MSDAVGQANPDSFTRREVNGEQLIDFTAGHTVTSRAEDGSAASYEHRYQITVNASRNYWPIRLETEVTQSPARGHKSRQTITVQGWVEAGPIAYPRHVELQSYSRPPEGSADVLLMMTATCDVESVAVNSDIPDSVFRRPFPAGTIYHDPRDWRWYEVDANGASQKYVPKPRGIRGAVLVYHLLWIAAGCVYLRRKSAGRVTRPMSEAVST